MNYAQAYRISLWVTVILTVLAYFTLLGWAGKVINGWRQAPFLSLLPWWPLLLLALTAVNCTIRKRMIKWRVRTESEE